ncbi:hypothetical protein F906_00262 [Acinetobacter pseudolwoffii]|uniref:Uncharacterized protein n=1 Tax=Acinetobacter pseudolwoffii TaxID=2053287 RepID=N9KWE9_9GAMM|nr:PilC/PilY family type IV pilus protein [Acinetobacter pseudolwoffii]ENW88353.1 hypothetical protein F906_00262 [Acinetobacter pseudolwoffii]
MKQIQNREKKSYCQKLLVTGIAAVCTSMIANGVTQASDIDIYQEAKSGQITLMFMLDISGSMDDYDAPSGGTAGAVTSTNGSAIATYSRRYKDVTDKTILYYYKRTGGSSNRKWFSCGSGGSTSKTDCIIPENSQPSTSGMRDDGGNSTNGRYYYKETNGEIVRYFDRITRLKDGMFDLLYGNATKGITKISDDKVIGLSTLGSVGSSTTGAVLVPARRLDCSYGKADCSNMPNNGKTQRTILLEKIAEFTASTWTPTAPSYAEVAAYLFGTRTTNATTKSIPKYFRYYPKSSTTTYHYRRKGNSSYTYFKCGTSGTTSNTETNCSQSITKTVFDAGIAGMASISTGSYSNTNRYYYTMTEDVSTTPYYQNCTSFDSTGCTAWSTPSTTTNPTTENYTESCTVSGNSGMCINENEEFLNSTASGSGFPHSADETKNSKKTLYAMPASLQQSEEIKKCSGQGIYVLTDGAPNYGDNAQSLMKTALGSHGSAFSCTNSTNNGGGWDCTHKFVQSLINGAKNPAGLKFKTAVVGFGSDFNGLASFDRKKTQQQNINALGELNSDVKKAAYWGIIGEGGWYSGNSSQDVVNSVNAFLGDLNTDIPSVTTGSPTIPKDALNPAILQDDAYYAQFQPTPDKIYSLWVGNLKKYVVGSSGKLQGQNNKDVYDSRGRLVGPTYDEAGKLTSAVYDFWAYDIDSNTTIADGDENTKGSKRYAAKGGIWSQLKLMAGAEGKAQRKLYTNRIVTGSGDEITFVGSDSTLKQVDLDYLTDADYKEDPDRGYLISLLGYQVDVTNPASITTASLTSSPELRQIGAIMHSVPELVTNKGKVTYNATTKTIGSTNREDYLLFGTTQGLLHVVDTKTGQEKFAFVPNEMIENQKEGFNSYLNTSGGMENLYYGIDGPWAIHTEYVIDGSGNLTVGAGKGINQEGKQLAFGGLRMGGRSYYSLDLQNIDSPKLNFHINPDDETTGPLSYMGQSWSKPSVAYVNWKGSRKLVMFVGGGYDMGYEDPDYEQENQIGAGVYMFSAEGTDAGELLWWASANAQTSEATTNSGIISRNDENMKYSVVSQIRTVDRDGDDLVDHLYFGDLGGQLFRIDLDNKASKLGAFSKAPIRILNLNNEDHPEKSPRFYDMPSFSIYNEKGTTFAVVSVGSGNRSKPLQNYTVGTSDIVDDAIYNIYDKDVARKDLYNATSWNTKDIESLALLNEDNRYSKTTLVAPFSSNGWYYKFDNCVAGSDGKTDSCSDYKLQSEKVFGTPLAMNYRLYVSTFDSSKPGISGDCGAGVKGESFMTTFCMPFGQCKSSEEGGRGIPIGIGIQNITTGNDNKCIGDDCGDDDEDSGNGSGSGDDEDQVASSSNYCASTGGRILVTTTGAGGVGQATQMCLIPQRWYEKNSLIR